LAYLLKLIAASSPDGRCAPKSRSLAQQDNGVGVLPDHGAMRAVFGQGWLTRNWRSGFRQVGNVVFRANFAIPSRLRARICSTPKSGPPSRASSMEYFPSIMS
jgi:hypothetical protein